jgi:hypothetical protein
LDEAASAQDGKEEKMTKEPKPDQNKSGRDSPKPPRHPPAQDRQIIRKDSDDRKIERTTDWNKPPRPKEK